MTTNCVCNFLKGVWAFIIGSLRVILFIGCAVLLLESLFGLWGLIMANKYVAEFNFPGFSIGLDDYYQLVTLFVLSLLGAHGAYSRDPKYLKAFAITMFIFAFVHFLIDLTQLLTTDWHRQNEQFTTQMKEYAEKYQFDLGPNEQPNKATRAWDLVQSKMFCCGLKGPEDWNEWRHWSKGHDIVPRSCCVNLPRAGKLDPEGKCHIADAFSSGCMDRILQNFQLDFRDTITDLLILFVYAVIAVIVAKQEEPDVRHPSGRPAGTTQEYRQFEGSVYVRQPMNDAYIPENKPQAPDAMYPSIHAHDKGSTPPPSYVART